MTIMKNFYFLLFFCSFIVSLSLVFIVLLFLHEEKLYSEQFFSVSLLHMYQIIIFFQFFIVLLKLSIFECLELLNDFYFHCFFLIFLKLIKIVWLVCLPFWQRDRQYWAYTLFLVFLDFFMLVLVQQTYLYLYGWIVQFSKGQVFQMDHIYFLNKWLQLNQYFF